MFAVFALVLLLAATVLAAIQRSWAVALLGAGLACWLFQTHAGML